MFLSLFSMLGKKVEKVRENLIIFLVRIFKMLKKFRELLTYLGFFPCSVGFPKT